MAPVLLALAGTWVPSAAEPAADIDQSPRYASIAQIQSALAQHQYTETDLVKYYAGRIDAIDQHGPALHSVIEINPEWQALTLKLDHGAKTAREPLFGVPVLLKDNIDTADKLHTTAGSYALLDSSPQRDAFIVRKLRAAGALILGKANLSEWAGQRSNYAAGGWSGRGGQTRNAFAPDRSPAGSSSGSAAAVAADLTAVAIGTDTGGSAAGLPPPTAWWASAPRSGTCPGPASFPSPPATTREDLWRAR